MPVYYLHSVYQPVRRLRSDSLNLLIKPLHKLKTSLAAFGFASPSVWNYWSEFVKSSESINIFKHRLKTETFSRYD